MADPTSLFIGQLCPSTNEKDLEACFDKYGPVVKGNYNSGTPLCFDALKVIF